MKDFYITVDIYCNWEVEPQAYRIYVDGDLLTERTYLWRNTDQCVQEHIVVTVEPGEHKFKLEPVDPTFTGFSFKHFKVAGKPTLVDNGLFIIN